MRHLLAFALSFFIVFGSVVILLAVTSRCQPRPAVQFPGDTRPRLEFEPRFNLNGGGFQDTSGSMTGGFGMELEYLSWHAYGTYNAAAKADYLDASTNLYVHNPHGNIRSAGGSLFGRTSSRWLFGIKGSYSSLRTTMFDKIGWGIDAGLGRDWMHATCPNCNQGEFASLRLIGSCGLPVHRGHDVEQGCGGDLYLPSPATGKHFVFHVTTFVGVVNGGHDASSSLGMMFRF